MRTWELQCKNFKINVSELLKLYRRFSDFRTCGEKKYQYQNCNKSTTNVPRV